MARKLKMMRLFVMAAFAFCVVCVSVASAQEKGWLTSDGPVTLTGTETGEGKNRLTGFGAFIECPGSTYTGHEVLTHEQTTLGQEHEFLPAKSTEVTITPHYNQPKCIGPFGWSITIDMNGCDYVLHLGNTTGGEHTYAVTFDIVCPIGKEITKTIWRNGTSHETAPFCVIHIPPQTGLKGAHATDTNTNDGHVELTGTIEGIKLKRTTQVGPHHSALLCGNSETSAATLHLDVTVKGHNEEGSVTELKLTD